MCWRHLLAHSFMQIRHHILLTSFVVLTICCNFKSEKPNVTTFYNNISDWDIDYIPIIDPFRASSIDGGITWSLNKEDVNSIQISEFGVSQNFIFGKGGNGWFLFDTKSKLYAEYNTQQ